MLLESVTASYKPNKGIAMGSAISGLAAEICLQHFEEHMIKHWIETGETVYYNRYVDDVFILFSNERNNVNQICTDLKIFTNKLSLNQRRRTKDE